MGYKFKSGITRNANQNEVADYWEVECLKRADHSASVLDVRKERGISDDIQETDDDDIVDIKLEDEDQTATEELIRRISGCNGRYPFNLIGPGHNLVFTPLENQEEFGYLFLLAATRSNMRSDKVHDGIDGTHLFEEICALALRRFLGQRSKSIVFGTGSDGGFVASLEMLRKELREVTLHPPLKSDTYPPQDDKLDVVAWIPFTDDLPSKLMCFAQSKTGTGWQKYTTQLTIEGFVTRWFSRQPAIKPIPTFMITDSVIVGDFHHRATPNLLFDRCRIAEYMDFTGEEELFSRVIKWTKAALFHHNISV